MITPNPLFLIILSGYNITLYYNDADFNYIDLLLDSVACKAILSSNDANISWLSPLLPPSCFPIDSSTFPSDWKNSLVVPIPKSNHPSSCPSNYYPFHFFSLSVKSLKDMSSISSMTLVVPVTSYLIVSFVFSQAFLQNLLFSLSSILGLLLLIEETQSVLFFFYLSKAFDSVPHSVFINLLSHINLL